MKEGHEWYLRSRSDSRSTVAAAFSLFAPRYNVRGRRSDNFEATGRAHSSFWSFLPIVLGEHIEIGITSKTVGPRPPWSEMIQICVLKKPSFFLGLILGRKPWFHQFWPHLPPLAIHGWKAMDLSFNLAPSYRDLKDPSSRQNFDDTVEQKHVIDLRACHIYHLWSPPAWSASSTISYLTLVG